MSQARPLIALAPLGLEAITAAEIRALGGGVGKTRIGRGRVDFEGPADAYLRANLRLRTAERILIPIGNFASSNVRDFENKAGAFPWEEWIPHQAEIQAHVSTKACALFHTGAITEAFFSALGGRGLGPEAAFGLDGAAGQPGGGKPATTGSPRRPKISVDIRGTSNKWVLSIDSSGPGLHRRGYRKRPGEAPLRETQAAALLRHLGWKGDRPFLDPMCGSGTLPIEAAWSAQCRASGVQRTFAFLAFPALDKARWETLLSEAKEQETQRKLPSIVGADAAASALRIAKSNGREAGIGRAVTWLQRELSETPEARGGPPGLVLINPPYGRRLSASPRRKGSSVSPAEHWAEWGSTLRQRLPGWTLALLSPRKELALAFGPGGRSKLRFQNGGLTVHLWVWKGAE